jgi:hypothetical protein
MFSTDLDELRTWPTERLRTERDAARLEERRWRLRRVALDRVLDERGATGGQDAAEWVQGRDQVRSATARAEVEVARGLESLPCVAAAAEAGDLSFDQLEHIVQLATPATDAEWAERGRHAAPSDLARMARRQRAVSAQEMQQRQHARGLRWWRQGEWLRLNGQIPDVDGALVEAVLEHMVNGMKPPKGEPWESRARRGADALVELCRVAREGGASSGAKAAKRWTPRVVVHVGSDAQPEVNGMPIALETVQQLIADGAPVREVHDADPLAPAAGDAIPAALRDHLVARDPICRVPGCERTFGLDAHHLVPRSRGGPTEKRNLAMICKVHHRRAVPHGPFVLAGDPERPDGLAWRRIDAPGRGAGEARAGPAA